MSFSKSDSSFSSKKKSFHIEKLRSLAFKTLMHSLRNEFNQIVPEYAQKELSAEHLEFMEFMTKAFFFIPKICASKKAAYDYGAYNNNNKNSSSNDLRKATLSEIFGFNSFNKQFRERVFGDYLLAYPILLILENYRHYRTKFKEEFKGIFEEFKTLCEETVKDFDAGELMHKFKKEAVKLHGYNYDDVDVAAFKIDIFTDKFALSPEVACNLKKYVSNGDLFNVFLTVVKKIETPLTIPGLKDCFELYLALLKIKYYQDSSLNRHTAEKPMSCGARSNASTGIPSESSTPRGSLLMKDREEIINGTLDFFERHVEACVQEIPDEIGFDFRQESNQNAEPNNNMFIAHQYHQQHEGMGMVAMEEFIPDNLFVNYDHPVNMENAFLPAINSAQKWILEAEPFSFTEGF